MNAKKEIAGIPSNLNMTLINDSKVDSSVHVVFNDEDIPFEEELLRNPHSLKAWLRYIEARSEAPTKASNLLYEHWNVSFRLICCYKMKQLIFHAGTIH